MATGQRAEEGLVGLGTERNTDTRSGIETNRLVNEFEPVGYYARPDVLKLLVYNENKFCIGRNN
ncbi:hypothetical protein ACFVHQ_12270 [Actinomycetes bacterium NPDC127524]